MHFGPAAATGLVLVFFSAVLCFGTSLDSTNGAENIILDGGSKGTVPFPHRQHQNIESINCDACHELFPKESGSIRKLIADEVLKSRQVMNTQCIRCHRKTASSGNPSGPRSCSTCHS